MRAIRTAALVAVILGASAAFSVAQMPDSNTLSKSRTAGGEVARDTVARPVVHPVLSIFDAETKQPLDSVLVTDLLGARVGKPDSLARSGQPLGLDFFTNQHDSIVVRVKKPGYSDTAFIALNKDSIKVALHRAATPLPTMVTTEKYRLDEDKGLREGFTDRCMQKNVACFSTAQLAARPSSQIYDFLAKVTGVLSECTGTVSLDGLKLVPGGKIPGGIPLANCVAKMHTSAGAGKCFPTYFLNGFEYDASGDESSKLLSLEKVYSPSDIQGIEVYLSQGMRPLRFSGNPFCGVIAIWTK